MILQKPQSKELFFKGSSEESFQPNHLASTDNQTKTTKTHEQYNNTKSIPNKRRYTMNTRKKILG